jgi:hypothetical protein
MDNIARLILRSHRWHSLLLVGCLAAIAIAPAKITWAEAAPTASPIAPAPQLFIKDELYFGLSKPDGSLVSATEWQDFVDRTITPRFPDGLTVMDAYGQYLTQRNQLVREPTKVVILIYGDSPARARAIADIIAIYKQRFQQESVLRLTQFVRGSF